MIKIIGTETCPSCVALKSYLKGNLSQEDFSKLEMVNTNDFEFDKLAAMGVRSIPVVILDSGEKIVFTNLLETSKLIKENLKCQ